jgi:glycosyltransferase involved in cell wall biosynthesis
MKRFRACFVCADPGTFDAFLVPHAKRIGRDFDLSLIASGVPTRSGEAAVVCCVVPIRRQISLFWDAVSLILLAWMFSGRRFDLVHSVTPKAGLLAMVAAKIVGVPVRLHTFTGQVWATRSGVSRFGLKSLDCLLAQCSTALLTDSRSQAAFLEAEKVAPPGVIKVIGSGSVCGVDQQRFRPSPEIRRALRAELATTTDALVFLFVGRLNSEKGVLELAKAFTRVVAIYPATQLWFVGPDESDMKSRLTAILGNSMGQVRFIGATPNPERYMASADVLCLPSHREGFGSVIIEAAACGCPCIGSRIYGISDAVVDERSGLLHEVRSIDEIADLMLRFCSSPTLLDALSKAALERARREFSQEILTEGLARKYSEYVGSIVRPEV